MKCILVVAIFLVPMIAVAAPPPRGKSVLSQSEGIVEATAAPERKPLSDGVSTKNVAKDESREVTVRSKISGSEQKHGNLPDYFGRTKESARDLSRVMLVPEKRQVRLKELSVGDILEARVDQAIVASPSVPTPIVARVVTKAQLGSAFIGEATLDRELKRVLIRFNRYRGKDNEIYSIKAEALQMTGEVGLRGEYHDQSGKFFLAEMASATSAGVLDSTINRSQTVNGGFVQEPSLANASKSGAVAALSRTADRMAERVRQAPEYTELGGDQRIKIIITEGGYLNE